MCSFVFLLVPWTKVNSSYAHHDMPESHAQYLVIREFIFISMWTNELLIQLGAATNLPNKWQKSIFFIDWNIPFKIIILVCHWVLSAFNWDVYWDKSYKNYICLRIVFRFQSMHRKMLILLSSERVFVKIISSEGSRFPSYLMGRQSGSTWWCNDFMEYPWKKDFRKQ